MEVVASLSQGRTAAAQCGLFTHKLSRSYLNHLVNFPYFISVASVLFIQSQFTANAQKCPPSELMQARMPLTMDCRQLAKVPQSVANGLTGIKNELVKCIFIVVGSSIK